MGFGKTLTMASLIARDVDEFFANSARSHGNPSGSYPGHGQGVTLVVVPLSCKEAPRLLYEIVSLKHHSIARLGGTIHRVSLEGGFNNMPKLISAQALM